MNKTIKMVLYAEPGVGKSTFAGNSDNPFFICTDGNYAWLGLPEENHVEVSSWDQCKKIFSELSTPKFDKYHTIVVDLVEDLFKWVEYEYCKQNKLNHISDQGYGKGYDITRNEFYIEISKILALNKNIILLSHGLTKIEKDRRGVENTKYIPSNRIPDKVWDMIEGRVRYFLRAYVKGEEDENGNIIKRRYLSIVPKENEYGISRGLDESVVPHDIALDWDTFATVIGLEKESAPVPETPKVTKTVEVKVPEVKEANVSDRPIDFPAEETKKFVAPKVEEPIAEPAPEPTVPAEPKVEEVVVEPTPVEIVVETPAPASFVEPAPQPAEHVMTQAEKIAAIKAKFAKLNQ